MKSPDVLDGDRRGAQSTLFEAGPATARGVGRWLT